RPASSAAGGDPSAAILDRRALTIFRVRQPACLDWGDLEAGGAEQRLPRGDVEEALLPVRGGAGELAAALRRPVAHDRARLVVRVALGERGDEAACRPPGVEQELD